MIPRDDVPPADEDAGAGGLWDALRDNHERVTVRYTSSVRSAVSRHV
jgi:hypothetical protein